MFHAQWWTCSYDVATGVSQVHYWRSCGQALVKRAGNQTLSRSAPCYLQKRTTFMFTLPCWERIQFDLTSIITNIIFKWVVQPTSCGVAIWRFGQAAKQLHQSRETRSFVEWNEWKLSMFKSWMVKNGWLLCRWFSMVFYFGIAYWDSWYWILSWCQRIVAFFLANSLVPMGGAFMNYRSSKSDCFLSMPFVCSICHCSEYTNIESKTYWHTDVSIGSFPAHFLDMRGLMLPWITRFYPFGFGRRPPNMKPSSQWRSRHGGWEEEASRVSRQFGKGPQKIWRGNIRIIELNNL